MNILIAAVGGQGALLSSRILGKLAQNLGKDVKVSEIHGMSQRGGSVVTYVKWGEKVYSPVIEKGSADVLLAFELLEGARYADYLKKEGTLIINTQKIDPVPVITGDAVYPLDILSSLKNLPIHVYDIDGLSRAQKAGNIKTLNTVLIGMLAKYANIEKEQWIKAITQTVPEKLLEVNLKAFEYGYEGVEK
jgi:indolepyruvate ferredoxin oxidoreductase beta subunit